MERAKVLLIILDGWGLSSIEEGNAPFLAKTPVLDKVYANYPKLSLAASGLEVGLNYGEVGNSEVGHLNIGSGRVVWEMLPLINQSISSGDFFEKPIFREIADFLKKSGGRLQLIGLCSTGGVHSHIKHLFSLLDMAASEHISSVFLHLSTDGRDTGPKDALKFIKETEKKIRATRLGKIASLIGRFYAMDRDNNWDRTMAAYDLLCFGTGTSYKDAEAAIEGNYLSGQGDEYLKPSIIDPKGIIKPGDALIFFNFREDRSAQLLKVFENQAPKKSTIENLFIATMTKYYDQENSELVFQPDNLDNVLADVFEGNSLKQFHTAETEKYAHVTYFFNGGKQKVHRGEKQQLVPSPKVRSYDLKPEMSAAQVTRMVTEAINFNYDFILVNYANGDMVGHTGNLPAAIKAVEILDSCLLEVLNAATPKDYRVLITADHGNCEMMINPSTKEPLTEHTTSPVPFCFLNLQQQPFSLNLPKNFEKSELIEYATRYQVGILADIAPTILDILKLPIPKEMLNRSLLDDF